VAHAELRIGDSVVMLGEAMSEDYRDPLSYGGSPVGLMIYVDDADKVWASEWSAQVMLRFDPRSEKFEVFRSSSTTANVRQIHGRRGEVWTPESAADKIVVYRYD